MPTAEEGTCEVARPLISCLWRHTSLIRPKCTVCCAPLLLCSEVPMLQDQAITDIVLLALAGYSESPYSQYSPQNLPQAHLQQQTENAASQMNQIAYAANNAAVAANNQNDYNFNLAPSGFTSQGCQPSAGPSGTKIQLRISGHYDIMSLTQTQPYAWVLFGNAAQKSPGQILKESQDASGACSYSVTVDAPPFIMTNWQAASSVPLTIIIESADGNELTRVGSAGSFTYTDTAGGAADMSQGAASPPDGSITRRSTTRSPPSHEHETSGLQVNSPPSLTVRTSATTSPTTEHLPGTHQLQQHHDVTDPSTNTYGYPPVAVAPSQSQLHSQPATNYGAATAYNQSNDTMLHAYRTSNYAQHQQQQQHHYPRSPTSLRSPHHGLGSWATYGGLDGRGAGYSSHHTQITRPGLQPSLPIPSGGPPTLVRTTSLSQGNPSMGLGGAYNPFAQHHKAILHIQGNLESMAITWSEEEWQNKRRIVMFKKSQQGSRLNATFRPVPVNERPPNNIYVSCIWWEEKQECFVTSVDTIHLLEQLVVAPHRFSVEEKNRIRRNLEGFKPLTVSKAKAESEDFFKVIMGFGNPKPRNIEKDVKVFPWKVLGPALKKIISKYSASNSSEVRQSTHHPHHLLTPVSVSSNYGLPPTPTTATDPSSATGYISNSGLGHHASLQESIPSPRSLGGGMHSSWAAYSTGRDVSRAMSPSGVLKTSSPTHSSNLRLSSLPTAYDTRSSQSGVSSHYGLPSQSSHHSLPAAQQSHAGRWDYSVNSISDTAGTYGGSRGGYDYGGYGDGTSQRA